MVQSGEVVLDFLECRQSRLAIVGGRLLECRARLPVHGRSGAGIQQRQRRRRAHGPEAARRTEPARRENAFITGAAGQRENREPGCAGHADLRIGRGHRPLRAPDVRPAFEQLGWQPGIDRRRRGSQRAGLESELRRHTPQQHRDRMLELRALQACCGELRAGRLALRVGLVDVSRGGDALLIAIASEGVGPVEGVDRIFEQLIVESAPRSEK